MRVVVFSGAGISRESGLLTFRDSVDGLWAGYRVEEVASIDGWHQNPEKVLEFYNMRRRDVRNAEPNEGHRIIAELEREHEVTVITQNVDDLHERAGSTDVIHLHGEVLKARPVDDETRAIPWLEDLNLGDVDPETGVQLRPHVVWFGEGLPEYPRALEIALSLDVDVLIVVGTTLQVYPAAFLAEGSRAEWIYLVDPNPPVFRRSGLRVFAEPGTVGLAKVAEDLRKLT